eukprot:36399-Karenia_brevis.AAC.1
MHPPFPSYLPSRAYLADPDVESQIRQLCCDEYGFLGSWTIKITGNEEEDPPEIFNCYAYDHNTIGSNLRRLYKLCLYSDFLLKFPQLDIDRSEDE